MTMLRNGRGGIWTACQFQPHLHAPPPRVQCPTHGVKQGRLPWAEARARFTTLFERLAIDVLLETDILGATRILRISWDEAWHIQERAVARGQQAKPAGAPARLGIDEKAAAKGEQYVTLVSDLDEGTVEYVGDDREQASLDAYFQGLTAEQRAANRRDRDGHVSALLRVGSDLGARWYHIGITS
jgi:transposase